MDKKNTIIGVALLITAFVSLYLGQRFSPPPPRAPAYSESSVPAAVPTAPANSATPGSPAPSDAALAAIAKDSTDVRITTLANDFIEVNLTDFGGAIRDVAFFKQYPAELGKPEPYVFNQLHADPILAFTEESFPGSRPHHALPARLLDPD